MRLQPTYIHTYTQTQINGIKLLAIATRHAPTCARALAYPKHAHIHTDAPTHAGEEQSWLEIVNTLLPVEGFQCGYVDRLRLERYQSRIGEQLPKSIGCRRKREGEGILHAFRGIRALTLSGE